MHRERRCPEDRRPDGSRRSSPTRSARRSGRASPAPVPSRRRRRRSAEPARPSRGAGTRTVLPPTTSISGARRMNSSIEATSGAPSPARIALSRGRTGRSITRRTTIRTWWSLIAPAIPGHGRMPGPTGGMPLELRNGVNGENTAQGRSPASAADIAPQQLASMISASGRTSSMALWRSSTSTSARLQQHVQSHPQHAERIARGPVPALDLPRYGDRRPWCRSPAGYPCRRLRPRRRCTSWPRPASSRSRVLTGSRWPSAGEP